MGRKASRRHAFIIIFQMPFYQAFDVEEALSLYFQENADIIKEDKDFICSQARGVQANEQALDDLIARHAGWEIDRLSKVDLAILRLALYEHLYMPDIPTGVSINEAVELAKTFGDDGSPAFINGLLGKATQEARGDTLET